MSRARELSKLGNPNIITTDSDNNIGFGTLTPRSKVDTVGVVSATSFYGDGSTLTNVATAGIGTALSDDKTNPLNQFYYTDQTFRVGVTTTIDAPTSANVAYTQAAEIEVADGVDLTVADGDSWLVDVLGISSNPILGGSVDNNLYFDTLYGDEIRNKAGTGSPNLPYGLRISGVTTASGPVKVTDTTDATNSITGALIVSGGVGIGLSLHVGGDVSIGGTLMYEDVTNIDVVGLATYRSGAEFGVAGVGGTIRANGDTTLAGVVTATSFSGPLTGKVTGDLNSTGFTTVTNFDTKGTLVEAFKTHTTAWNSAGNLNISEGNLHYNSTNLGGTGAFLNVISTAGINTDLATGQALNVTAITSVNATTAFVNALKIDGKGTGITTSWVGGSVPTDGGGSGVDTYSFNILKTGSETYVVVASQTKTS